MKSCAVRCNMQKHILEKKYEKAFEQAASLHPVFPSAAKEQMAQMVEVIARGNKNISTRLSTNQKIDIKGGFIAEEFHAETYNLDAVLKNDSSRAITDRYTKEWHEQGLRGNDNPDIVIVKDGEIVSKAQSKYMRTPKKTAGQFSQITKDKNVKYEENDVYLAPSDQVEDIIEYSKQVSNEKKKIGDEDLSESFRQTSEKTKGKIEKGDVSSKELSKKEANELANGKLDKLKEIESEYQTDSTLQQMGNAAVGAAAMSAVVSGSVNTITYIQLAREGKISADEAVLKIVGETVSSAADSAVKASANAGVQSLMVRYGSKEAAMQVLAKQGMQSMLKTNAVTVGVTCAVDAVKDLVRLGMGDITKEEFFDRQGKGVLMTSAGVVGGSLGAAGGTAIATALGASSGTLAMSAASLVGGLAGGMIAGLAMTLAIEVGIEKPYRDLVQNTQYLQAAAAELQRTSMTIFKGQVLFTKYIEADQQLENALQIQLDRIDAAGERALAAINRI